MTNEELTALDALCSAATPGPWDNGAKGNETIVGSPDAEVCGTESEADARFIAAAREAVPALIAALRAARDELAVDRRARAEQAEAQARRAMLGHTLPPAVVLRREAHEAMRAVVEAARVFVEFYTPTHDAEQRLIDAIANYDEVTRGG